MCCFYLHTIILHPLRLLTKNKSFSNSSYNGSAADCRPEQFQCQDGSCVDKFRKCDKIVDCLNGEDEHDCNVGGGFLSLLLNHTQSNTAKHIFTKNSTRKHKIHNNIYTIHTSHEQFPFIYAWCVIGSIS